MYKKWPYAVIVLIGISAIITIYKGPTYTGFATLTQEWNEHVFYIFPILLMLSILLVGIFKKRDILQQKLKEMEEESPSPSLENTSPSEEEQNYFKKRNSYIPFFSKVKKKKQDLQAYTEDSDYQEDIANEISPGEVNPSSQEVPDNKDTHLQGIEDNIRDLMSKRGYTKDSIKRGMYDKAKDQHYSLLEELESKKLEPGIKEIIKNRFNSSIHKEYESALKREFEEWDQLITKREGPVTYEDINRTQKFLNRVKDELGEAHVTKKYLLDDYVKRAKTKDVSEAVDNNSLWLVHAIPYGTGYVHIGNNPVMKKYAEDKGYRPEDLTLETFLDLVTEKQPTLSGSVLSYDSDPNKATSPVGVIYKEGKIYDATANPGEVTQNSTRVPDAKLRTTVHASEDSEKDLDTRIDNAINREYNEFVVGGDNAEVQGLYYMPVHKRFDPNPKYRTHPMTKQKMVISSQDSEIPQEALNRIAQYAIDKGMPLYRFEEGMGFIKEENPRELIKKTGYHKAS